MSKFDAEYLVQLRSQYADVAKLGVLEQAEKFKLRYVLSIGEDVMAIDDRAQMFLADLPHGQTMFDYNDPKFNKYLEKCQISFESFLVRNQELNVFSPFPGNNKLSFIQFLLHDNKEMILKEFAGRWQINAKSEQELRRNKEHTLQAILSEFLDQPPFGTDKELDQYTKDEREKKVAHTTRVTQLQSLVDSSSNKKVKSVKDKQAEHQLAILRQTNIQGDLNIIRAKIDKLSRQLLLKQQKALKQVYDGTYGMDTENSESNNTSGGYVLPAPWEEYVDERTGAPYFHNPVTGATQWQKP